nr:retrovirus-related Pol polyprotein from transposon TNT 1-94 [Tanacetum cinerariifolium]
MQIEDYLYQQKLHEHLEKAKHTGMKAKDWTLLDRQALGVARLSLAKNVAYNVVNEKTTYGLFKALSNMYEKPSTVTSVSGSIRTTKLKFDNILDLILGEYIRKKTSGEYPNSLLSVEDKGMGRKQDRGQKQNRGILVHRSMLPIAKKSYKGSSYDPVRNKRGSMYMVEVPSNGINTVIDGRGNATLWPQRLGHMSEKGIKILASNGRILDLQKAVVGFYKPCILGKQKNVSFVKFRNTRKLQRLKLVHIDVYGPTYVASIGGSRYYVTFIDDNNRKVLEKFNMKDVEPRCHPLGDHFKLSKKQAPKMKASRQRMAKIPYASVVGSVIYVIVYTRLDIAHAVGVVSRFMSNPGKEHWEVVK